MRLSAPSAHVPSGSQASVWDEDTPPPASVVVAGLVEALQRRLSPRAAVSRKLDAVMGVGRGSEAVASELPLAFLTLAQVMAWTP
jgi:hypothetical protein